MTCMERMLEYTRLPQEPPRVCEGGGAPPAHWPRSGAMVWEEVCARYRPGLPLVLQVGGCTHMCHAHAKHLLYAFKHAVSNDGACQHL